MPLGIWLGIFVTGSAQSQETEFKLQIQNQGPTGIQLEWTGFAEERVYTAEFRETFSDGEWQPLSPADQWPTSNTSVLDSVPLAQGSSRFYRVSARVPEPEINRGELISWELIRDFNSTQLDFLLSVAGVSQLKAVFDISIYKMVYLTVDLMGEETIASGTVAFPTNGGGDLPLVSYQHSVVYRKSDAPSRFNLTDIETLVGPVFGSSGFFAVSPDYLGLGDSPGFHPFTLAEPTATAVVDALRAARHLAVEFNVTLNNQVFLMGYSQGGYSTMAAQRAIEEFHSDEFSLTATAPMAGPYDLAETMLDVFLSDQNYIFPSALPYFILAYNEATPFFGDPAEIFLEPYLTDAISLFDGTHSGAEIDSFLPLIPKEMLREEFLDQIRNNPDHPFRKAFRENTLLDWVPQTPMRMFHCASDEAMPIENAHKALESFKAAGADSVELIDPASFLGHVDCSLPSVIGALEWFVSLRN